MKNIHLSMVNTYYQLPLSTERILNKKESEYCTIKQSIRGYIHLIITSHFGECTFDPSFGCSIWNIDFDNLTGTSKLRDTISESLSDSITSQEKRLKKVSIKVFIKQEEFTGSKSLNRIKKRVDIAVTGVIKQTNESFTSKDSFFIAPLSF